MNDEQIALAGSIRESSDRLLEITGELLKNDTGGGRQVATESEDHEAD